MAPMAAFMKETGVQHNVKQQGESQGFFVFFLMKRLALCLSFGHAYSRLMAILLEIKKWLVLSSTLVL